MVVEGPPGIRLVVPSLELVRDLAQREPTLPGSGKRLYQPNVFSNEFGNHRLGIVLCQGTSNIANKNRILVQGFGKTVLLV